MPIIALGANEGVSSLDSALNEKSISSFNLFDSPPQSPPKSLKNTTTQSKADHAINPAANYPTPTSPLRRSASDHHDEDQYDHPSPHAGPSQHRAIPPPPNPRRHRSGVLMSRVRAASNGSGIKLSANPGGSKSHGDLASFGGFTSLNDEEEERDNEDEDAEELEQMDIEEEEGEDGHANAPMSRRRFRSTDRDGWKRHVSEGSRKASADEGGEDTFWDNSARYYHRLHSSRPPSGNASIANSPEHSPQPRARSITSPSTSPIYLRRNLTLPTNGPGPPTNSATSVSLSPNQHFLQTHLPPTFHHNGSSPENSMLEHHGATMVFTPTTQEWRDLQTTPEWQELHKSNNKAAGDMEPSFSGSSSEDESKGSMDSRSASGSGDRNSSLSPQRTGHKRPTLHTSVSAEYLGSETQHTPDPGSPLLSPADEGQEITLSPSNSSIPVFNPVIIAPSPIMPVGDKVGPISDESPTKPNATSSAPVTPIDSTRDQDTFDDDDIILADPDAEGPVRFASIGRRDSLRVVKKAGDAPPLPRTKTKRELEREKLLSMVDEELEADQKSPSLDENNGWGGGVQEIGSGLGLGSTPPALAEIRVDPSDIDLTTVRSTSADPVLHGKTEPTNPFENTFAQVKSLSLPGKPKGPTSVPSATFKPSPLQASPVNAPTALESPSSSLTSPAETPNNVTSPTPPNGPTVPGQANLASIRDYAKAISRSRHPSVERSMGKDASPPMSPRSPRRRDTNRVSLVAGRVVQPFAIPPSTALPPSHAQSRPQMDRNPSLQSFSPFRSPALSETKSATSVPQFPRLDSTISIAPSTIAPSECPTPTDETAGGIGGRGIDDYVILSEAGKGAYGLVMRAKVKGPKGEPVGDEVIIKYIIKARILADCWKKHKVLGPIPVELHVMDQLRHLLYHKPTQPLPWDPARARPDTSSALPTEDSSSPSSQSSATFRTPESNWSSAHSDKDADSFVSTQKYIAAEIKTSPERGHPNIGKLLDFFEDREFYYLVMPRFGTGLDLFDRVESSPSGLEPFEIRSLLGQLCDAVRFLHANGIVHRDIKDENVILDGKGRCQLIDFGSAAHWRPGKRWDTFSGTLHYASPEILRGEMYGGKEQDVWALGVVGYVLLVGETPFSELPDEVLEGLSDENSRANQVLNERCFHGHQEEGLESDGGGRLEDASDLVKRCLELELADRPTAEVLTQHRYLKGDGGWVGKKGWLNMTSTSTSATTSN
uniref:CAMK/CAMKL/PASK protein kinase n=1 Tax=Kwoniella dejecticola CBS 10117 TaxID=1296121 RepID=A0A1A6A3N0_9TREE|nr:CAMK/CAMKL/PASK protein kinase [Kwoniella dejecticola CBS 10117]OBR84659.1 CAMK/CAMKL/PASK protein kinase [Kwoniella dejecticola CBS 10117]